MRAWYRVRQFWQALTTPPRPEAPAGLPSGLQELFRGMPPADRAHGLRTWRLLAEAGEAEGDLAAAALLHDVGKSRAGIRLSDRVLFVLAGRLAPGWLARQRGGLAALQDHATEGARLVAAAGATARTVSLIRHHHTGPAGLGWPEEERRLLAALQRSDEAS